MASSTEVAVTVIAAVEPKMGVAEVPPVMVQAAPVGPAVTSAHAPARFGAVDAEIDAPPVVSEVIAHVTWLVVPLVTVAWIRRVARGMMFQPNTAGDCVVMATVLAEPIGPYRS